MRRLLSIALLAGCTWAPAPVPPSPRTTGATCAEACQNLRHLGCLEGEPTEAGESCEAVCDNARDTPSLLPTTCMANAMSCEQAAGC